MIGQIQNSQKSSKVFVIMLQYKKQKPKINARMYVVIIIIYNWKTKMWENNAI